MGVEPTQEGFHLPTAVLKTEEPTRTQSLPGFEITMGASLPGSFEAPTVIRSSFGKLLL